MKNTPRQFRSLYKILQPLPGSKRGRYAVPPFQPAKLDSAPHGVSLAGAPQRWKGQTSVFQAHLQCIYPMSLTSERNSQGVSMDFDSGDSSGRIGFNITMAARNSPPGGGWWPNRTTTNHPLNAPDIFLSSARECERREMVFVTRAVVLTSVNGSTLLHILLYGFHRNHNY